MRFNEIEIKILELSLINDDRVQQHNAKEIFGCHYLPDIVQHLRPKLGKYFKTNGTNVLFTEYHTITKSDEKVSRIGIYRINELYKPQIKKLLELNIKNFN